MDFAKGVVGLAPEQGDQNMVRQMYKDAYIPDPIVGLNFENSIDTHLTSSIDFGQLNYNSIVNGKDGLSYHANIGADYWALPTEMIEYGDDKMTDLKSPIRTLIDTGNSTIQLPDYIFNKVYEAMKKDEKSIFIDDDDSSNIVLRSKRPCYKIENNLKRIKIVLSGSTWYEIQPEGYTYYEQSGQQFCMIGI